MDENEQIILEYRQAQAKARNKKIVETRQTRREKKEEDAEYELFEESCSEHKITDVGVRLHLWMRKLALIRARRKQKDSGLTDGACFTAVIQKEEQF
jgi:hypothetical protein